MPNGKVLGHHNSVECIKPNVYKAAFKGKTFAVWDAKRVKIFRPSCKGDTVRLNQASNQFFLGYEVRMQNNQLYLWRKVKGPDGQVVTERVLWEGQGAAASLQFDRV